MAHIIEVLIYGVICNRFSWFQGSWSVRAKHFHTLQMKEFVHILATREKRSESAIHIILEQACSCGFDDMMLLHYAESYCRSVVSDIWDSSCLSNIFSPPPFMAHQLRDELRKETLQLASESACPFSSNYLFTFSICYGWLSYRERLNITIFYIRGELGEGTTDYGA